MKVVFTLSTGFVGAKHRDVMEFPDETTDEELEEYWKEWVWEKMDGSWYHQKEKADKKREVF